MFVPDFVTLRKPGFIVKPIHKVHVLWVISTDCRLHFDSSTIYCLCLPTKEQFVPKRLKPFSVGDEPFHYLSMESETMI